MILNRGLYETLPAIYILVGFTTSQLPGNVLAFMGGALFTLSGVLAYAMRAKYRSRRR